MIDSGLVFFNNINVTTNVNSPVISLLNYQKYSGASSLSLMFQYNDGLLAGRFYQLYVEQAYNPLFGVIGWTFLARISSGDEYYNESFFNKQFCLTKMPIYFPYLRARFVVSGASPRSLQVAKLYLTI